MTFKAKIHAGQEHNQGENWCDTKSMEYDKQK